MAEKTGSQGKQAQQGNVDPNQNVETNAYVPTYKVKPEFKKDVLNAIGDRPFNEIAKLIDALDTKEIDHNTLDQVIKALGQFSYNRVVGIIHNVNSYIEQKVDD